MSGELVSPPRLKNPALPKAISDIVMRAMAPEITDRYQRAPDLLNDILTATAANQSRRTPPAGSIPKVEQSAARSSRDDAHSIQTRVRAREAPSARFCWQCRKPLHARADRCPFCGETQ
jgi:hypothetical protein